MNIKLHIDAVDGETTSSVETPNADTAWSFLHKHDHEGSSVVLEIETDNPDLVYLILKTLRKTED